MLWVLRSETALETRTIFCAHIINAGHRYVKVNLHRLSTYCAWRDMGKNVVEFKRQYLHCVDSRVGNIVPRSHDEMEHGSEVKDVL